MAEIREKIGLSMLQAKKLTKTCGTVVEVHLLWSRGNQGNFISQIEWVPFKSLFWNTNDLTELNHFFYKQVFFLRDRPFYLNMLIYDSDRKCRKLTTIWNSILLDCREDTGFCFTTLHGWRSKKSVSKFQVNYVTMFYVLEYFHLDT